MKRLCMSMILVIAFFTPSAFAGEVISSRITDVTLFSGEALVTRNATAAVQKGMQELLIEIEAFRVDSDSVSAKVMGSGEVYGVQIKDVPVKASPRTEIADLEKKIKELRNSRRVLTDQRDVLSKKEKFLESLLSFAENQVSKDIQTKFPKIEDISRTLAFLGSQLQTIDKGRQALDLKVEMVDEEIKRLERELAQLGTVRDKVRRFIEIVFHSSRDQTVTVEASYMCGNAYWQPLYKVAVASSLKDVDLTMFSKIRQKTGEDWNDVAVSLSNVIPLRGVEPPEPSPWILDIPRYERKARRGAEQVVMEKA
ncbi:MAG: mucoidy inhibitor MuiA family protein, partial [Deltaproteobacteria bacterium]|nr:mucoidy inhibitor MuiA family protein [Deltaproteobacteria bacterium]